MKTKEQIMDMLEDAVSLEARDMERWIKISMGSDLEEVYYRSWIESRVAVRVLREVLK